MNLPIKLALADYRSQATCSSSAQDWETSQLIWLGWVVGLAAVAIAIELSLRVRFGLGNPLLYISDEQIGYLIAPNQNLRRFGKHIYINAYSMRSPDMTPTRPPDTLRVLLLGDSIANGGSKTDQADTISERLRRCLDSQSELLAAWRAHQVEVLNASASSWSPRNQLAYLQRFGCFEAQIVVLLLNTDDLFGTAPTSIQIGRDRHYPNRKPRFALAELLDRHPFQSAVLPEMQAILAEPGDRVGINLQAIQQICALVEQSGARLILAMTPLLREVTAAGSRDYEVQARQRLQDFTVQLQIPYLDLLAAFQAVRDPAALYYDRIHLSSVGHQLVSDFLWKAIAAQTP